MFSSCWLLVCKNTIDFCIGTLFLAAYEDLFIRFNFIRRLLGFFTKLIMSSENRQCYFSLSSLYTFHFFYCLLVRHGPTIWCWGKSIAKYVVSSQFSVLLSGCGSFLLCIYLLIMNGWLILSDAFLYHLRWSCEFCPLFC